MKQRRKPGPTVIDIPVDVFTACAVLTALFSFLIMYLKDSIISIGISCTMLTLLAKILLNTRESGVKKKIYEEGQLSMYGALALLHCVLAVGVIASYVLGFPLIATIIGATTGIAWTVIFVLCHIVVSRRDAIINDELKK